MNKLHFVYFAGLLFLATCGCVSAGPVYDLGYSTDAMENAATPEEKIFAANEIGRILADLNAASQILETNVETRTLDALKIKMRDQSALVRAAAVRAATGLKEKSVDAVAPLLSDPEEIVRLSAIQALGSTGSPAAAKALSDAFNSEQSELLRIEMINAYSKTCERFNLELFEKALDDPNPSVVFEAVDALERYTSVQLSRNPKRWKEWLEINKKYAPRPQKSGN